MKVGIDYRPALLKRSGIGRYTRELVRALGHLSDGHQFLLYGYSWAKPVVSRIELGVNGSSSLRLFRKRIPSRAIRWAQKGLGVRVESFLGQIDLFHYTDYVFPATKRTPCVATIHDTAFLEEGFFEEKTAQALRERTLWAIQNCRLILVPSVFSAGELVLRMGARPERVVVTPLGADHLSLPTAIGENPYGPYLFSAGTLEPRKNYANTLAAFEQVVQRGFPHRWVIAGARGWLYDSFFEKLSRSPARERVTWLDQVDDKKLVQLYAQADAMVYASRYEGFGFPNVEAMRLGVPVITSSVSSMPEISGDAAVYVNPLDPKSIEEGILNVLEDSALRERLREAGKRRAQSFLWRETAEKTLSSYEAAVKNSAGKVGRLF